MSTSSALEQQFLAFSYGHAPSPPLGEWSVDRLRLQAEIESFLYYEAELLDQWRYEEWLGLITDDIRYWMPLRRNVRFGEWDRERTRPLEDLAYFDENRTTLAMRVSQLQTGEHWAEEPISRISHLITNVRITEAIPSVEAASDVTVRCRFLVYRNHLEDEESTFIGKREDGLRRVDGEWRISRRAILLDQNVLLAQSLTFLF